MGQGGDWLWQVGRFWNGCGAEEKTGAGVLAVGLQRCPRHSGGLQVRAQRKGQAGLTQGWVFKVPPMESVLARRGVGEASEAAATWRGTGQWLRRGRGNQAGPPDRGEGKDVSRATQEGPRANRIASQSARYSHSRSSGLDLAKKVSSTLALMATASGCAVVALPTSG